MKYLLLGLIFMSCAHRQPIKLNHAEKIMNCMERFADHGYNAESLVLICGEVYKERN